MSLTNSKDRYGTVAKIFHWLTALFILTLIPLGIIANNLPFETSEQLARKAMLFSTHKTLGLAVFLVALARILWAISQPKPGLLHPNRVVESWAAETVHWLLYGSLVIVPLSGWIHHAATTGFAPIWWPFGQSLAFVPKDPGIADVFAGLHKIFERVLVASIFLHTAGAIKHHLIDKDATLRRMWFGASNAPATSGGHRPFVPLATAIVIWAAALFAGNALGFFSHHDGRKPAAALASVQSDWLVQDGTLAIKTTQFNQEVTGQFTDWTAAIRFDPNVQQGTAGDVDVTISIGSLTLGNVTSQAFGADFFNLEAFPTATFVADIVPVVDGYEAQGTLTVKDQSMPVVMPFGLSLDGDTASMRAGLQIDRREFAVGNNMTDEGQLKFAVTIEIDLIATKTSQ